MKTKLNKLIAFLMAFLMVFQMAPVTVLAEGDAQDTPAAVEESVGGIDGQQPDDNQSPSEDNGNEGGGKTVQVQTSSQGMQLRGLQKGAGDPYHTVNITVNPSVTWTGHLYFVLKHP